MYAKEKIMVDLNELQKRIYDNKIKKGCIDELQAAAGRAAERRNIVAFVK